MWKGREAHGGGRAGRLWRAWLRLGAVAAVVLTVVLGSFAALAPARAADDDSMNDPCWSAGLDSESWFACPTLRNLQYTAGPMDNLIQGWLTVETDLYNLDSPAYTVWEIMRNIANALMIVFLLAIIFSQLTGIGIDNYGIKKMLPRLITMAVLINLSFFICEIAIDLSNVLGVGLRNLFGSIGNGLLEGRDVADYMKEFIGTIITAIFAVAGVAGVAAPTGLVLIEAGLGGGGTMVAVIIILALVVVVAAILLFFVALGARMVIIIMCVAVAPVAFALYILPNTQNLFKKWWDIFKAALIMFPICGAIGGVSVLIKAMVLTSDGIHLWMLVVALIAPFLPFFLLPTLLKNTIAGLGKVGGALMAMGDRFSGGMRNLRDTAQRSEPFQNRLQYARETTAANRAQRRVNRYRNRFGVNADGEINTAAMGDYQRKRLAAAHQTILANEKDKQQTEYDASVAQFEAQRVKQGQEVDRAAAGVARYGSEDYAAAMAAADEEREIDAATAARLSLMQSSGAGGGIVMDDGAGGTVTKAYTLENMRDRMKQLEEKSRTGALSGDEELEMAALARGMTGMAGGTGMLGKIIRGSSDGAGGANTNFMNAMGAIYARDGAVKGAMAREAGASIYTEQFMPGGTGAGGAAFADYQSGADYAAAMGDRVKSHAAGLGQSGAAFDEYLQNLNSGAAVGITGATLDASGNVAAGTAEYDQVASEYQKILNDDNLMNSLDAADRVKVEAAAANFGVNGKSATTVQFGEGSTEAQAMSDLVDNTGATVANTAAAASAAAATAANTGQIASGVSDLNDGVLQIRDHAENISKSSGMVDVGFVKDRDGNLHHVRQTADGRYINDQGQDMGNVDPKRIQR